MATRTIIFQSDQCESFLKIERRASVRYPSEQDMSCQVGTIWLGRVLNISRIGIGFTTNREFWPGRTLIVDLSDDSKGSSLRLPARVVHATPKRKNRWVI